MTAKRKISIRKILQVLLTLVVTTCCILAITSASKIEDRKMLKSVAIHFKNDKKYHFIEEKEIMDLAINNRHTDITHIPASKLDIHSMEQLIMADPWVAHAQVFIDNERILHMYVTQRIPVVRVFQQNNKSFYLDTTTSIMPLSGNYVYYTSVVTNVPDFKNDSVTNSLKKDLILLARTIQADSFWNAQVSQIIVDSPGMYELVPVLGDHKILFGDAKDIKEKLNNLFYFYKNVLNRIGWDKYQTLDIRFDHQVVASPSLPYSGPVDKAVTNMNWINSIVESEAIKNGDDEQKNKKPLTESKDKPVVHAAVKPVVKSPSAHTNATTKTVKATNKVTPDKTVKKQSTPAKQSDDKNNKKERTPKYIYPEKKVH